MSSVTFILVLIITLFEWMDVDGVAYFMAAFSLISVQSLTIPNSWTKLNSEMNAVFFGFASLQTATNYALDVLNRESWWCFVSVEFLPTEKLLINIIIFIIVDAMYFLCEYLIWIVFKWVAQVMKLMNLKSETHQKWQCESVIGGWKTAQNEEFVISAKMYATSVYSSIISLWANKFIPSLSASHHSIAQSSRVYFYVWNNFEIVLRDNFSLDG